MRVIECVDSKKFQKVAQLIVKFDVHGTVHRNIFL